MYANKKEMMFMEGTNQVLNLIDIIKKRIINLLPDNTVLSMYLFGSYARNEQTKDSDVDMLLIYDENKISELDINIIIGNLSSALISEYWLIFHILCIKNSYYKEWKDSSLLFKDIQKEGILC